MTRDELEFSISQYLDGTLGEAEGSALEERLSTDADARAVLSEYRRLDAALKGVPGPAVDWDAFASRVSRVVAAQDPPAQSYRLHWVRAASVLAVAASALVAIGFGIRLLRPSGPGAGTNGQLVQNPPVREVKRIEVVDRSTPAPAGQAVQVIAVGPPTSLDGRPLLVRYQEDLVSRPSQVIIARGGQPYQDNSGLP
jgi:negative regulator of sigma E activity